MIMQLTDNSINQRATEVYVTFIKDPLTQLCNKVADEIVKNVFRTHNRRKSKIKRRNKK